MRIVLREEFRELLPASSDPNHDHAGWKDPAEAESRVRIADPVLTAEIFARARALRDGIVGEVGGLDRD